MDIAKIHIVVFSFVGGFFSHIVHVYEKAASDAVNTNSDISRHFTKSRKILLKNSLRMNILPVILLCLILCAFLLEIGIAKGSILFAIALFVSVIYKSVYPNPEIVQISWAVIYSLFFSSIVYLQGIHSHFSGTTDAHLLLEVLKVIISFIIVLSTVTGVCMTILWTMNPNNLQGLKTNTTSVDNDKINLLRAFTAFYMVILFVFIVAGMLFWIGFPLYNVFIHQS